MMEDQSNNSFQGVSVVSCGVLWPEISALRREGFLDADDVFYTAPGLHETPKVLREQLNRQLFKARRRSDRIVVVYGRRCYLDFRDPLETMDEVLKEVGNNISRVEADSCVDMLASAGEREAIAGESKVYWLTPGWLLSWKAIFRDWDQGKANEMFPRHDKAVLLDPLNFFAEFSARSPEKVLEFSDWMKIPIEPYPVTLERLQKILLEAKRKVFPEG